MNILPYKIQQVSIRRENLRILIGHINPLASQLILHEKVLNEPIVLKIVTMNVERNFHKIWML